MTHQSPTNGSSQKSNYTINVCKFDTKIIMTQITQ